MRNTPALWPDACETVYDNTPPVDCGVPVLETFPDAWYTPSALHKPATDIPPVNVALTALKLPLKVAAPVHVRDASVQSPLHVRDASVASPVVVKVAIVKAPAALSAICKYDEALESRRGA